MVPTILTDWYIHILLIASFVPTTNDNAYTPDQLAGNYFCCRGSFSLTLNADQTYVWTQRHFDEVDRPKGEKKEEGSFTIVGEEIILTYLSTEKRLPIAKADDGKFMFKHPKHNAWMRSYGN